MGMADSRMDQGKHKVSLEPLAAESDEDVLREVQAHIKRTNQRQSEQQNIQKN